MRPATCILLLLFFNFSWAQNHKLDSLKEQLASAGEDTNKVNLLNAICLGSCQLGYYSPALDYGNQAKDLAEKLNYRKGMHWAYSNIGSIYFYQGDFASALSWNFKSLKIREELGLLTEMSWTYTNIGNIYSSMGNTAETVRYYRKCLEASEKTGNKISMCYAYNSLGIMYFRMKKYDEALESFQSSLQLSEGTSAHLKNTSNCFNNMGEIYRIRGNYEKALEYYSNALKADEVLNDQRSLDIVNLNIGSIYFEQKKFELAEDFCLRSLDIARNIGDLEGVQEAQEILSRIYENKGNDKLALEYYKGYIATRDSIFNEESTKKQVRAEMNFEFEKKETAAKAEQEKKEAVALAEQKKQRIILFSVSGLGLLVLGFAIFAWRSFLQKKKANVEISRQKQVIEEKQKEILDSIYYARRIQRSLLTNEKYIAKTLSRIRS